MLKKVLYIQYCKTDPRLLEKYKSARPVHARFSYEIFACASGRANFELKNSWKYLLVIQYCIRYSIVLQQYCCNSTDAKVLL